MKINLSVTTQNSENLGTRSQFLKILPLKNLNNIISNTVSYINIENKNINIDLILVDELASQDLNFNYRHKKTPTNILSFLYENNNQLLWGELILCWSVIKHEAEIENKSLIFHLTHLIVHGTLHLLDYDHETDQEANTMEQLEIEILAKLGYDNPYL